MKHFVITRSLFFYTYWSLTLGLTPQNLYSQEKKSVKRVGKSAQYFTYLGLGGGAITSKSEDEEQEFSKKGYSLGLSGVFSRRASSVTIDGTVGWRNSRLLVEKNKEFVGQKDLEIRSDYFHLDLAPMLKISSGFWAGPVVSGTFGTDTTFSPVLEHTRPNYYAGIQANIYAGKKDQHRFNIQLMTDVSIQGRQVFLMNLNYHIGVELFSSPKYVVKTVYKESDPVVVKEVEEVKKYQFVLDGGIINFATGQALVTEMYQDYLKDLSKFLAENNALWTAIFIRSHTDFRGGAKLNKELSKSRADAVISHFIRKNIDREKIKIHSNSFSDPVESSQDDLSLAKNRRVEIIIISTTSKDAVLLNQKILNIKQKNRIPTTCLDGVCQ